MFVPHLAHSSYVLTASAIHALSSAPGIQRALTGRQVIVWRPDFLRAISMVGQHGVPLRRLFEASQIAVQEVIRDPLPAETAVIGLSGLPYVGSCRDQALARQYDAPILTFETGVGWLLGHPGPTWFSGGLHGSST